MNPASPPSPPSAVAADNSAAEPAPAPPVVPAAAPTASAAGQGAASPTAGKAKARKPVLSAAKAARVVVLPSEWFYPMPNDARHSLTHPYEGGGDSGGGGGEQGPGESAGMDAAKAEWVVEGTTKAIHYWACSWNV